MNLTDLVRENEKLRKINRVLIDRVERSTDAQGNAFSLFQAAITLEKTVQQRTGELQKVNAALRREIEERSEIEAALESAKIEAERANTSKTKFFAAASHDLLQPLNIARLFLDVLAERAREPDVGRLVERIDTALEGAESLLGTLLEMSRLDAGAMAVDMAHFALDPLLERIGSDYALQAEERELRLRVVPSGCIAYSDIRLLDRVLRNLVSNALRYTNRCGVLVGCRRRGAIVRIEVWDTGIGIPQDRLAEVFEEFKQLDVAGRNGQGLGLGLSIVDRIARLLGMERHVRSTLGRGSVFAIDVPRGDPARVAPGDAASKRRANGNPLFGKTILVVDDDQQALEGMSLVLRNWGCRTIEARSVEGALEKSACITACPDFIVADFHLGERTGLEAIDGVRTVFASSVAAVVVTADRTAETQALVARHGHWYLNKPVRIDRLRSLMSHVLAS